MRKVFKVVRENKFFAMCIVSLLVSVLCLFSMAVFGGFDRNPLPRYLVGYYCEKDSYTQVIILPAAIIVDRYRYEFSVNHIDPVEIKASSEFMDLNIVVEEGNASHIYLVDYKRDTTISIELKRIK